MTNGATVAKLTLEKEMGHFSYICKHCDRPILDRQSTWRGLNEWMATTVVLMEGGSRVIEIGPSLAYGAVGFPPRIPPQATLIFHVTLLNRVTIAEAQATIAAEIAAATAEAEARDATPTP